MCFRNVGASMEYPLNRFSASNLVRSSAPSAPIDRQSKNYDYYFDHIDVNFETVREASYVQLHLTVSRVVTDNSLFGNTVP